MISKGECDNDNGAIVCLDQEKAYDKISHAFLWATLEAFNFPKHFIDTIKALYQHARTKVLINGELSSFFSIHRGVHQGDSPSCFLFDLAIEPLAALLCDSPLMGFTIPKLPDHLIAIFFADDTTVFLASRDSYEELLSILHHWCQVSGAKFNIQKTTIIPIGSPEHRKLVTTSSKLHPNHDPLPPSIWIANDGEPTHALGAYVGNNIDQISVWTPTIEQIDAALKQWNKSHPTYDGCCLIINMVIGGRTQYLTCIQGMPPDVETLLTQRICYFMADDTPTSLISLDTFQHPPQQGGKKLLNLKAHNQAIELIKCKAFLNLTYSQPKWAILVDHLMR